MGFLYLFGLILLSNLSCSLQKGEETVATQVWYEDIQIIKSSPAWISGLSLESIGTGFHDRSGVPTILIRNLNSDTQELRGVFSGTNNWSTHERAFNRSYSIACYYI